MPKSLFKAIMLAAALLAVPVSAWAHGGVEKTVGTVRIYLNQAPLSPLVGEEVSMSFVFAPASDSLARLADIGVEISVIRTTFDRPEEDEVISTQKFATDANGGIDFRHVFPTADYYDVELKFTDPVTAQEAVDGFLVQPRQPAGHDRGLVIAWALVGLAIGSALTALVGSLTRKAGKR
jgi:hypothetical protein